MATIADVERDVRKLIGNIESKAKQNQMYAFAEQKSNDADNDGGALIWSVQAQRQRNKAEELQRQLDSILPRARAIEDQLKSKEAEKVALKGAETVAGEADHARTDAEFYATEAQKLEANSEDNDYNKSEAVKMRQKSEEYAKKAEELQADADELHDKHQAIDREVDALKQELDMIEKELQKLL